MASSNASGAGAGETPPRPTPETVGFALSDVLSQLDDYTPTIPDSVSNYFLHAAGFESSDPRMLRLLSVAAQKFICDIVNEAYIHCKLRVAPPQGKGAKGKVEKRLSLSFDDLAPVLADYAITVRKPPYYL